MVKVNHKFCTQRVQDSTWVTSRINLATLREWEVDNANQLFYVSTEHLHYKAINSRSQKNNLNNKRHDDKTLTRKTIYVL